MHLFICKFSITFPPPYDADNPERKTLLENVLDKIHQIMDMMGVQFYEDYSVQQPEGYYADCNAYLRTDYLYAYRYFHTNEGLAAAVHLSEGAARCVALVYDAQVQISYPEVLPELCPPPQEPEVQE